MKKSDIFWALFGIVAVISSCYLLINKFQNISIDSVEIALKNISSYNWGFIVLSTVGAYYALAWYDRLALKHLDIHHISFIFITLCSFTTYALAHNIGASVFSGGAVRFRAYSSKQLHISQIAILIAFCAFTFAIGTLSAASMVLIVHPEVIETIPFIPINTNMARLIGFIILGCIAFYLFGASRHFKPLQILKFSIEYPNFNIALMQIVIGTLEVCCAAAIIYFALPEENHPGYLTVLGIFLASFSASLISNAPGGIGVLEILFVSSLPELDSNTVIASLLVFRLFYLIIPLIFSIFVVIAFEYQKLKDNAKFNHSTNVQ